MSESDDKNPPKWHHPSEVMKLHNLKLKKRALQARMNNKKTVAPPPTTDKLEAFQDVLQAKKRKNPFIKSKSPKKYKHEEIPPPEESSEPTLFKLLNGAELSQSSVVSFENILSKVSDSEIVVVKGEGVEHPPIDWSLKTKMRLWSSQPFPWNHKLKISEEASGTTGFVRCLDIGTDTKLDTSPNAKFHQCCHYWQHPSMAWMNLFPRNSGRNGVPVTSEMRTSLQTAWSDSLRSLFHLIRTKQCPYFYLCSNTFTILFRAAGVCGFSDVHALINPTTRGFRHVLEDNEIEFTTPLKKNPVFNQINETNDETKPEHQEEEWLKSMGINHENIKKIKYTQERINQKSETEIDNQEESLVMIDGVELNAFYNFLLNCKSTTATSGALAGITPTLLCPVAFSGATLSTLKIRENKIQHEGTNFYSIELSGPILPTTVHNLFALNHKDTSATFANLANTQAFNKVTTEKKTCHIFNKENLMDCGLSNKILDYLCRNDVCVTNLECLKYNSDKKTYTWT